MEFVFETDYDQKTVTAMVRAVRKSVRKRRSRRTHIFGVIVLLLSVLLLLPLGKEHYSFGVDKLITALVSVILLLVLLFEDRINAWIARKRMMKRLDHARGIFREEGYISDTELGRTEWRYENIHLVVEMEAYFVFIFDSNHAQIYDKKYLSGGTVEEFRSFIEYKTAKPLQYVK